MGVYRRAKPIRLVLALVVAGWVLSAPAAAFPGDGRYPLPALPRDADQLLDVAALLDASVVASDSDARVWRLIAGTDTWREVPGLRAVGLTGTLDGALLAMDAFNDGAVVRWAPGALPTVVAGGRVGFGGDGGPATAASLRLALGIPYSFGVAEIASGGFVFTDTFNNRVRLVDGAGIIRTVAGNGREPGDGARAPGEGGPATMAPLGPPSSIAVTPDGGYVIGEAGLFTGAGRVRRVLPDGTIRTIGALSSDGGDLAVLADGSVLVADGSGLRRLSLAGGAAKPALRGHDWIGRQVTYASGVSSDGAGGVLLAAGRIWYVPAAAPRWRAVALRGTTVRHGEVRAVVDSTVAGAVRMTVSRGDQPLRSAIADGAAGHIELGVRAPLAEGWYRVQVRVEGGFGDTAYVYFADRLSRRAARALMGGRDQGGDEGVAIFLGDRCRAFGLRRVDCEVRIFKDYQGGGESCLHILSVTLDRTGIPHQRGYRCGNRRRGLLRAHPNWRPALATRIQPES